MERSIRGVGGVVPLAVLGIRLEAAGPGGSSRGSRPVLRPRAERRCGEDPRTARTAVSRTAGTSTLKPVTSALIWFHVSLRAGPPQTRIVRTSAPAATIPSATCRIANADASRTARVRWPRPCPSARPANAPRCRGIPERRALPGEIGQKHDAAGAGGDVPASSINASVVEAPPRTSSRNQSSARPVAAIAPPTEYMPGSGAIVENEPATSSGRSQYRPKPPAEPPGSIASPGRVMPAPWKLAHASTMPAMTGMPARRPRTDAASGRSSPTIDPAATGGGILPGGSPTAARVEGSGTAAPRPGSSPPAP